MPQSHIWVAFFSAKSLEAIAGEGAFIMQYRYQFINRIDKSFTYLLEAQERLIDLDTQFIDRREIVFECRNISSLLNNAVHQSMSIDLDPGASCIDRFIKKSVIY